MSRERADEIYRRLRRMYPYAKCSLDFETPFQLLVATILSAQSTDRKINEVTPELFRKYPSPQAFVSADQSELEKDLKPTGFFRQKAKSVQGASAAIVKDHDGEVPKKLEELVALPGVGRKTTNVVMGNAFGKA
ncbi:MAG: endonuclease III, partial [Acidobacteria bacterium]|nr:endonuclease III [Acidobacteriota bacterium]